MVVIFACDGALATWWCRDRKGMNDVADLQERVRILEETMRGEAKERRSRRSDCLTKLDGRMTAHEQICLVALTELESAART